jgi:hypothetical protein
MLGGLRRARSILRVGLSAVLLLGSGCQPASPLARAGVALSPGARWQPVERARWPVPGKPLAAWSGPDGSSLVAYQALPIPGGSAGALVEELANRFANLPGLRVEVRRTESWSSRPAARVEVVAPGTGDALAASGIGIPVAPDDRPLVPTRRVLVGFPRAGDTLFLAWHAPESARGALETQIQAALQQLRLGPGATSSQSY